MTSPPTGRRSLLDHPARYVVSGFVSVIALGTALLLLPWSSSAGSSTTLLEAGFTATSAVTVTGLAVVDTGAASDRQCSSDWCRSVASDS